MDPKHWDGVLATERMMERFMERTYGPSWKQVVMNAGLHDSSRTSGGSGFSSFHPALRDAIIRSSDARMASMSRSRGRPPPVMPQTWHPDVEDIPLEFPKGVFGPGWIAGATKPIVETKRQVTGEKLGNSRDKMLVSFALTDDTTDPMNFTTAELLGSLSIADWSNEEARDRIEEAEEQVGDAPVHVKEGRSSGGSEKSGDELESEGEYHVESDQKQLTLRLGLVDVLVDKQVLENLDLFKGHRFSLDDDLYIIKSHVSVLTLSVFVAMINGKQVDVNPEIEKEFYCLCREFGYKKWCAERDEQEPPLCITDTSDIEEACREIARDDPPGAWEGTVEKTLDAEELDCLSGKK